MVLGARLREETAAATAWRYRWPLAFCAFLLSPMFFYELRLGQPGGFRPDRVLLFAIPSSLLLLALLHLAVRRLWLVYALLGPFVLSVAIDLWTLAHYGTRLTASMLGVALENLHETGPFLRAQPLSLAAGLLALLFVYGLGLWKMRDLRLRARPGWLLFIALAVIALYVETKQHMGTAWADVASHDRGSPFGVVPALYTAWSIQRDEAEHHALATGFRFGAHRDAVPDEPEVYLLVIGESSRPDHWGLYGYPRDTTPRLAAESGLVVFRDVLSPASVTLLAVPLVVTRARVEQLSLPEMATGEAPRPEQFPPERSIVSAFAEAGFETFWFSTQQRDQWTGHVNWYSGEARTQRFFDRRYDGVLVDAMQEALAKSLAAGKTKLFFVLHTSGSHYTYTDRFPPEQARFSRGGAGSRGALIDAYDDSILYGDAVIDGAIAALRARVRLGAVLYVGDHGENLEDDARRISGHFHNNEYDLPVPMVLWTSEAWASRFPGKLAAARANAGKPLSTQVVFHTLADLAGIAVEDDRRASLSVLRDTLQPPRRLVLHENNVADFDSSEEGARLASLRVARGDRR